MTIDPSNEEFWTTLLRLQSLSKYRAHTGQGLMPSQAVFGFTVRRIEGQTACQISLLSW